MSRYHSVFRNEPSLVIRRSAWKTVVSIALALASVAVVAYVLSNFAALQLTANEGAEQAGVVRNQVYQRLAPVSGLVLGVGGALWFTYAAIFRCREWFRRETGNRLRRRVDFGLWGGVDGMHQLRQRFATGDPAVYTPVPTPGNKGDLTLEAWLVPEDSVAYVGMHTGRGGSAQTSELLTFTGAQYLGLAAAVENKLDRPLPDDMNPLRHSGQSTTDAAGPTIEAAVAPANPVQADTAAALTSDAADPKLQQWAAYLQGGGTQQEQADAEGITSARTWNTAILASSLLVLLGGGAALLWLSGREEARGSLLVVLGIFLVLVLLVFVPRMLGLRRNLAPAAGPEVVVSSAGVQLRGIPLIAWNDLLGLVYLDDRRRSERAKSVPVTGWGLRLAFRAGEGSIGLTFVLRDGASLRSQGARVKLWPADEAGLRGGAITVPLDVRLAPDARERAVAAVRGGAIGAGVPFHVANDSLDYAKFLGRMLDPKWGDTL